MKYEPSEPTLQPNMAERAMDTAADVSRTLGAASANLKAAVERLIIVLDEIQSGTVASSLRRAARRAPLTSLLAAFVLGTAFARSRRR